MKFINKTAETANRILMVFVLVFAILSFSYGLYVLCDIFCLSKSAFISHDLLQYRPGYTDPVSDSDTVTDFSSLREINPDTVGWLELFGTHINYPVVQGNDDLEYLNKDIYGNSTLTGSIYLASGNSSSFNDWYSLIYGHHMENGAMFGDIANYLDKNYFDSHNTGILQTADGNYRIDIFACISTDSYEGMIYNVSGDAESRYPQLKEYISQHAYNATDIPDDPDSLKLLALSTCSDAVTNGRIVLFGNISGIDDDEVRMLLIQHSDIKPSQSTADKLFAAVGTLSDSSHWALLNLICVLLTLLTLFPVLSLRRKFRQLPYSRKLADKLEKEMQEKNEKNTDKKSSDVSDDISENNNRTYNENEKLISDLRSFVRKMRVGILFELIVLIVSAVGFLHTENVTKPVVVRDGWTGIMILIAAAALLIDFICFRYRGTRPQADQETENRSV